MEILAAAAALMGIAAYVKTKHNLWLVGGALMIAIWPYKYLMMGSSGKYLL